MYVLTEARPQGSSFGSKVPGASSRSGGLFTPSPTTLLTLTPWAQGGTLPTADLTKSALVEIAPIGSGTIE